MNKPKTRFREGFEIFDRVVAIRQYVIIQPPPKFSFFSEFEESVIGNKAIFCYKYSNRIEVTEVFDVILKTIKVTVGLLLCITASLL